MKTKKKSVRILDMAHHRAKRALEDEKKNYPYEDEVIVDILNEAHQAPEETQITEIKDFELLKRSLNSNDSQQQEQDILNFLERKKQFLDLFFVSEN